MAEPPASARDDGADLASTDMSAEPSSRDEETQAAFGRGSGVPVEPDSEAIRRLESQLEEARDRQLTDLAARQRVLLDDMDRLSAEGSAASAESLREAVGLVDRKLRKELEAAGVERIDPVGQPFDPSLHEAVSTVPPPKPELDHTVSATFQTGYRFKGNLVRPARVQVYSAQGQA